MSVRPTLRAEQRAVTRSRLLDSGREVLLTTPYHAVTVDQLVRAAGVSRATFYLYYTSKRELLDDLVGELRRDLDVLWPKLGSLGDGRRPTRAAVVAVAAEFVATAQAHRAPLVAWVQAGTVGDELHEVNRRDLRRVQRLLYASPSRAADTPVAEQFVRTTLVVSMLERFCFYWFRLDLEVDPACVAQVLGGAWWSTLYGDSGLIR
ncbi:MAG: TetR/AcrR family transcriptional regulator [Actinomycetota bacterium]|nr:TetR/AcrR family transcriptional regulator [Actinomycetota bacterium]